MHNPGSRKLVYAQNTYYGGAILLLNIMQAQNVIFFISKLIAAIFFVSFLYVTTILTARNTVYEMD